jgi:hypothetical protein
MGRRLPTFAPVRAAAGRKRKGATLATLAACKRPAPAQATGGWASLPTDIVGLITCRILDNDVVDYICFRAVCSDWHACTPTPCDPTLRDPRLRPRAWVALCDGDAVRPDHAGEITFFHTRTARRLRVLLPELRGRRIVGITDGLLILVHKRNTKVSVLHPFTRVAVDLPSLAPAYHKSVRHHRLLDMNAAVCSSASSIAVVVWFLSANVVLAADPNSDWEVLHRELYVGTTLPFQGRLYATSLCSNHILQLYPPPRQEAVAAVVGHVPYFADRRDRALFLGGDRCLSVSARDLPSLSSNSIYFSLPRDPIVVHSLGTGLSEPLAKSCQIHDMNDRIRPSVRPFTIVDHLITYANPSEWYVFLAPQQYPLY